jgi:hypothetical protein
MRSSFCCETFGEDINIEVFFFLGVHGRGKRQFKLVAFTIETKVIITKNTKNSRVKSYNNSKR